MRKTLSAILICFMFLFIGGMVSAEGSSANTDECAIEKDYSSMHYGKYIGRHLSYCTFMFEDINYGTIYYISDRSNRSEASWGLVVGQCYKFYYTETGLAAWCDMNPIEKVTPVDCELIRR